MPQTNPMPQITTSFEDEIVELQNVSLTTIEPESRSEAHNEPGPDEDEAEPHVFQNSSTVHSKTNAHWSVDVIEIQECCNENEAFIKAFGKDHPGYVRGLGLGVTSSQIIGSCSRPLMLMSILEANVKIAKIELEIVALKGQVAQVDALKAQVAEVDVLKQQLVFLMQTIKGNQVK
ncbi:hypothetical protein JHK87_000944 [Glycine soja]|nr:hypothetical protein JHK87_000944 [Glycine soja]